VAAHGGRDDLSHLDRWRRDAFDGIRSVDRGMEADYRRAAANLRRPMAGRIREIPDHSAIPRAQPWHEPRRLQDNLLVGMVAPAAGKTDGRGLPFAISRIPRVRHYSAGPARAVVEYFCRGRGARCGWLVDGFVRPHAGRERLAISSCVSPDSRHRDLWGHRLDRAATDNAKSGRGVRAPALFRAGDRVSTAGSDLSRGAGRRS